MISAEKILLNYCDSCGEVRPPEGLHRLKSNMISEDFVRLLFAYRDKVDDLVRFEKIVAHPEYPELFKRKITTREAQVLAEVAMHGANGPAAQCLEISEQTVKNHLSSVYKKLGVGSVTMALSQTGWLNVPTEFLQVHPEEDEAWSA
jgi:DNA-binding NarL/FixJ family response regulator